MLSPNETKTSAGSMDEGQHQQLKQNHLIKADHGQSMQDDEDDNECWDDAKEDQNDNDGPLTTISPHSDIHPGKFCLDQPQPDHEFTDNLQLHEAVFKNNLNKVKECLGPSKELAKQIVNKKDKHGNTALHLACMLGRSVEMVKLLLENGASVESKNLNKWTPFHEACSYGNRDIITQMTRQLKDDVYDAINKNKLSVKLEQTRNYRLVLKWEFQSWVPFLARVLPSDVCVINKQGKNIRIDTRVLDFEVLSWKRGDSCLIYSRKFKNKWVILNNKKKRYQNLESQSLDGKEIEDKVDDFMSTDIMDLELKSSDIQLTRSISGWIWRANRMERIGKYNAALYDFNNVFLVTRKRREHLTEEEIKRNKIAYNSIMNVLKFGKKSKELEADEGSDEDDRVSRAGSEQEPPEVIHRESLAPPQPTSLTWTEYCASEAGKHLVLGREQKCKTVKTAFSASVAMSNEFPITKNEFLDLLSIVPLRSFKKLKEFIEMRLPDGFPIRLDIPVFPFLTARITFEDFNFVEGPIDESLFSIPDDYEEDPHLFPFLSGGCRRRNSNPNNS